MENKACLICVIRRVCDKWKRVRSDVNSVGWQITHLNSKEIPHKINDRYRNKLAAEGKVYAEKLFPLASTMLAEKCKDYLFIEKGE